VGNNARQADAHKQSVQPLKLEDDVLNELTHLVERSQRRFSLNRMGFRERYVSADLKIIFDLGPSLKNQQRFAIVECLHGVHRHRVDLMGRGLNAEGPINHGNQAAHGDKRPVFVADVHFMDGIEEVIPSRIRFQCGNEVSVSGSEFLGFFCVTGWKFVGDLVEWEMDVVDVVCAVQPSESANQVVERRPNVVDRIPNEGQDLFGNFLGLTQNQVFHSPWGDQFSLEFGRARVDEFLNLGLKVRDVGIALPQL